MAKSTKKQEYQKPLPKFKIGDLVVHAGGNFVVTRLIEKKMVWKYDLKKLNSTTSCVIDEHHLRLAEQ